MIDCKIIRQEMPYAMITPGFLAELEMTAEG